MVKLDQTESTETRKQTRDKSNRVSLSSEASTSSSSSSPGGSIEASLKQHQLLELNYQKDEPSPLKCFVNALTRKKPLDCRTDTNLNRCLNLIDLTALGKLNQ